MQRCAIGLMGLAFYSGNKGCSALAYSFSGLLEKIAVEENIKMDIYIFTNGWRREEKPGKEYSNLYFHIVPCIYRSGFEWITNQFINKCDIIFDFTAGDSFSDIYGEKRFDERTRLKETVLKSGKPLVLGSQTYGPFNNVESKLRAIRVIHDSYEVFSRDPISSEFIRNNCNREPIETTDIAFMLDYEKRQTKKDNKNKVGINPSGLLWNGGYSKDNQFGLMVDYKQYIRSLVAYLIAAKWEVYLVPHVLSENLDNPDNDLLPCYELISEFSELMVIDNLVGEKIDYKRLSPSRLKSSISQMNLFIGARMHATIAAYSTEVPVIPFSYSRKFQGLFNRFDYPFVIDGTKCDTDMAIKYTINWIINIDDMRKAMTRGREIIKKSNDEIYINTLKAIKECLK